jgi:hypothetical protein
VDARAELAAAYRNARYFSDAISLGERAVADYERRQPGDAETLTSHLGPAYAYAQVGRSADASPC